MQNDAVKGALAERVTTSVLNGAGGILPIKDCTTTELELIEIFLRAPKLPKDVAARAADLFKDRQGLWKDMLLCRGLLVHRILVHALLKRWNVQYGLHPVKSYPYSRAQLRPGSPRTTIQPCPLATC